MLRFLKQIFISLVFLSVLGLIVYFSFFGDSGEPTLTPQVSVKPLEVLSSRLLKVNDSDYDFLVEIKNPNPDWGAARVSFELRLLDGASRAAVTRTGSLSLLPGQIRYEVVSPIIAEREVSGAEFKITDVSWERLKNFIPRTLFLIKNQDYSVLPPEQGFSRIRATVFNNSNFDFDRVDVSVVLFDERGEAVAAGRTDIRTFVKGTDRFFEITWPDEFEGEVKSIEINAYTDVFSNSNFIKEHGTQEEFQRFY